MPKRSPQPHTFFLFTRMWFNLNASFPYSRFDNTLDDDLAVALDDLAREHIELAGGKGKWIRSAVKADIERAEALCREHAMKNRGSATWSQNVEPHPPSVHTQKEREAHYRTFEERGLRLFDIVKENAAWLASQGGVTVEIDGHFMASTFLCVEQDERSYG